MWKKYKQKLGYWWDHDSWIVAWFLRRCSSLPAFDPAAHFPQSAPRCPAKSVISLAKKLPELQTTNEHCINIWHHNHLVTRTHENLESIEVQFYDIFEPILPHCYTFGRPDSARGACHLVVIFWWPRAPMEERQDSRCPRSSQVPYEMPIHIYWFYPFCIAAFCLLRASLTTREFWVAKIPSFTHPVRPRCEGDDGFIPPSSFLLALSEFVHSLR